MLIYLTFSLLLTILARSIALVPITPFRDNAINPVHRSYLLQRTVAGFAAELGLLLHLAVPHLLRRVVVILPFGPFAKLAVLFLLGFSTGFGIACRHLL
jgi:hypothetical protein